MTLTPEGRCQSKFFGKDKGATITGNWLAANGWLVVTVVGKTEHNWTDSLSLIPTGDIEHFRIHSLNASHLVMAAGGQTNTYNRK